MLLWDEYFKNLLGRSFTVLGLLLVFFGNSFLTLVAVIEAVSLSEH